MNARKEKGKDFHTKGDLESPFLNEELFAEEHLGEASALPPSLISESPFLHPVQESMEEEVIGKDDRVLVTDTLRVPNRWICAIDILVDNPKWGSSTSEPQFRSKSRATGILIGPRYVLTARHIMEKQTIEVDGKKKSVEVKGLRVSPARNANNSKNPFGLINSKAVRFSQPYWIRRKVRQGTRVIDIPLKQHDDYALIILEKDLDSLTRAGMMGTLGYWGQNPGEAVVRRAVPDTIKGKQIVVIGYPGDTCGRDKFSGTTSEKERMIAQCWNRRNEEWASTQWRSAGMLDLKEQSTAVLHTADTYEGQSGAPICLTVDGKLHLIGIHTAHENAARNNGVRVTRRTLRELCAWMNADAGYTIAAIKDDTLVVQPKSTMGAPAGERFFEGFAGKEDEDENEDENNAENFTDTGVIEFEDLADQAQDEIDRELETAGRYDPETMEGSDHSEEETPKGLAGKLKVLSLLPHSVEAGGKNVALTPDTMDPGIYDGPVKYKGAAKLQECLMDVMNKKAFSHMKVALVDLSKDVMKPEFAGFNHKSQVFAASVPKIAAMLAAFQLREDLRAALKQKGSKTVDELFALVRDDWAATQADPGGKTTPVGVSFKGKLVLARGQKVALSEPKAPQPENVFAEVKPGNPVTIEFKSTGQTKSQLKALIEDFNKNKTGARAKLDALGFLERMRIMVGGMVPASNYATSAIVRDVGFLYIASTLLQSGLYDSNRGGGLWLGADYWGHKWRGPLVGGAAQSATVGSLAAFMTLLVQKRLVSPQASAEMRALMKKEPNSTHPGIVSWFKEGLKGLRDRGSLHLVLSKLGAHSGVDDCTFIEREVDSNGGKKMLRYVAVGLRARTSEELKSLILKLDKCVLANNGLTAAQGGHA